MGELYVVFVNGTEMIYKDFNCTIPELFSREDADKYANELMDDDYEDVCVQPADEFFEQEEIERWARG